LPATYPTFWLMVSFPSLATAIFAIGLLNLFKVANLLTNSNRR
jgi:hypothetical protein